MDHLLRRLIGAFYADSETTGCDPTLDASPTSVPIGTVHPLATFARARFHPGKLANSPHSRISPWRSCEHANVVSLTARRTVGSISVSRAMLKSRAPSKRPHRAVQRALGFGRERGYRRDDLIDIFGLGHKYIGQGGELRGALGLANPFVGFDRGDAVHRRTWQRRERLVRVGERERYGSVGDVSEPGQFSPGLGPT